MRARSAGAQFADDDRQARRVQLLADVADHVGEARGVLGVPRLPLLAVHHVVPALEEDEAGQAVPLVLLVAGEEVRQASEDVPDVLDHLAVVEAVAGLDVVQGGLGLLVAGALEFLLEDLVGRHVGGRREEVALHALAAPARFDEQDLASELLADDPAEAEFRAEVPLVHAEPRLQAAGALAVGRPDPDVVALDPLAVPVLEVLVLAGRFLVVDEVLQVPQRAPALHVRLAGQDEDLDRAILGRVGVPVEGGLGDLGGARAGQQGHDGQARDEAN